MRTRPPWATGLCAGILTLAIPSAAQTAGAPSQAREHRSEFPELALSKPHWYGGQTLTADAASLTLFTLGAFALRSSSDKDTADALGIVGVVGYVAAPPVIHAAHGNVWQPFASAGLRFALPVVGFVMGLSAGDCLGDSGASDCIGPTAGLAVGILAASTIDAAVFAREKPRPTMPAAVSVGVAPVVGSGSQPTGVAVYGRF